MVLPAGGGGRSAAEPAGLRFRLRQKSAVPPVPAEAALAAEAPAGTLGEWPLFWEDPVDNRER